jgi:hypothetical protein
MLDVVVGALAGALVVAGIIVIAGPALPRLWRGAWAGAKRGGTSLPRPPRPPGPVAERDDLNDTLHPTTMRALTVAARAYSLLRANGEDRVAFELRAAARLVRSSEAKGLLALAAALKSMREVGFSDDDASARYRKLVRELSEAVKDRSEQLELLHF